MAAQEMLPWPVQNCNPPAAARPGTDKPRPLSAEVAHRPSQGHGLPYLLPFSAWTASVAVSQDNPLRFMVPYHHTADGARLPSGPRPAQRELVPWLQQAFPVEVAHVYAMTLTGRGLLI